MVAAEEAQAFSPFPFVKRDFSGAEVNFNPPPPVGSLSFPSEPALA